MTFKQRAGLYIAFVITVFLSAPSSAATYTKLVDFNGSDGARPEASLVQGIDGNFYGSTYQGGSSGLGTLFTVSSSGLLTTLYTFCINAGCTDGSNPTTVILAANGTFYGITQNGGSTQCLDFNGCGTVFSFSSAGVLTTLHTFCMQSGCPDGWFPETLLSGSDGNLYGTTLSGGANGSGTVFKLSTAGTLTTLHSFCARTNCVDGSSPVGLVEAGDGQLYGTSWQGGSGCSPFGCGTIFSLTMRGLFTTLYRFCTHPPCTDGFGPNGGLVQGTDGSLYGTTSGGGATSGGTAFRLTGKATLTTLYSFCHHPGCQDGSGPTAGLVLGTDGSFYGTTTLGGVHRTGTIFSITSSGVLTTLYNFCSDAGCADGFNPVALLVQTSDGTFYGTTATGGAAKNGTIFTLSLALP